MPEGLKTALVTGASRGIGRASALALAAAGIRVLVHYGRGAAEAEAVVGEIRAAGGAAEAVSADLAAAEGPHQLAAEVRRLVGGRLNVLVANAGISKAATIEETTLSDFDRRRHPAHRGRPARRALGRVAGRSVAHRLQEPAADVRQVVFRLKNPTD